MAEIIVAGAGIVGVSAAIWLQRAGHKVTLVDKEGPGAGTSHGNAGVLASGGLIPVTTPGILRHAPAMLLDRHQPLFLRWSYLPRLLPFLRQYLAHATPEHVRHYARNMSMLLGDAHAQHVALSAGTPAADYVFDQDYCTGYETQAAYQADAASWAMRKAHGVRFEVLTGQAYHDLDPIYRDQFHTVVACKDHGRISDPGAYVQALAQHFVDQGGSLILTQIDDVLLEDGQIRALETGQGPMRADHIVLALGAWSAPIARKMGIRRLGFESERGYHVEFTNPSHMPAAPMMVASGKFVIAPMEGRIRCAGLVEFGGLDAPASRAPFEMLMHHFHRLLPDVTYDTTVEWMGHRPSTTDSLPLIGPVDASGAGYVAFGHQHLGLTAGPKTGRIIADMIAGARPNADFAAFDPRRYA